LFKISNSLTLSSDSVAYFYAAAVHAAVLASKVASKSSKNTLLFSKDSLN